MSIKKIIKEEMINEIGGSTILNDFRPNIEKLLIDILDKYGDKVSETNVTHFLMKTVETVGSEMGFNKGFDPNRYKTNNGTR